MWLPAACCEPRETSLLGALRQFAEERPDQPLYTFLASGETPGETLTFGDLDARSRAVAARIGSDPFRGPVLIACPPGLDFVVAFFGCLYAGRPAVPCEPPHPSRREGDRLPMLARDAGVRTVLTTGALSRRLPDDLALQAVRVDEVQAADDGRWDGPLPEPDDIAFLQYTSGSTASPKGVAVTHGNLLHNQRMIQRAFQQSEDSVIVGWLPLFHDMGLIGNILQPLFLGARCYLMSPLAFLQKPARWLRAVSRFEATTSGGPDFAYDLCVRKVSPEDAAQLDLSRWTVAFDGAEPVRARTLDRFAERFASCGFRRSAFQPCYGLAEATLLVSASPAGRAPSTPSFDAAEIERGRAVPARGVRRFVGCGPPALDTRVAIVHPEDGKPLADGCVGEIWVAGPSVAAGYWNRPEETRESFGAVLAESPEHRFLRTGDLGFLHGGEVFVTGRLKDLVILRGRNIYPQDVEHLAEEAHPALLPGRGAAFPVETDAGERLVMAHEIGLRDPDPEELRAAIMAIRRRVAAELEVQPLDVVLLPPRAVPTTSSGKIRRRVCRRAYERGELPALASDRLTEPPSPTPTETPDEARSPVEAGVRDRALLDPGDRARAAARHLRTEAAFCLGLLTEDLDPDRPLTELGLDSLRAVELIQAADENLGLGLTLESLLEGASVNRLAQEAAREAELEAVPALALSPGAATRPVRPEDLPLSSGQRRLWVLDRLDPGSSRYNLAGLVRLSGSLDLPALAETLTWIAGRHDALRTTFAEVDGQPRQRVAPPEPVPLPVIDLSRLDTRRWRAEARREAGRGFDLERDAPARFVALRTGASETHLLATLHHIVSDGWSMGVLFRELVEGYRAHAEGDAPALPEPLIRLSDHAADEAAHRTADCADDDLAYWLDHLDGLPPEIRLPRDRQRPLRPSARGAQVERPASAARADRVTRLARKRGVTPFTVLLAAFQALLFRISGQTDFTVGTPVARRASRRVANLIGFLANTLVLRSRLHGDLPADRLLSVAHGTVVGALAHQDLPFDELVRAIQPERDLGRQTLFQVLFTFEDLGFEPRNAAGVRLVAEPFHPGISRFDLSLFVRREGETLRPVLRYATDLFDGTTAERMARAYERVLDAFCTAPERPVGDLPVLGPGEEAQLVREWNGRPMPAAPTLPERFARVVGERPDAVAVAFENEMCTYAELDRRAEALAGRLLGLGVGPDRVVGLCLPRSPALVAAILGIHRAGGAYLPLDPDHPDRRLAELLRASGARALVSDGATLAGRPELAAVAPTVRIDEDDTGLGGRAARPVPPGALAYVIYTSGSTGQPKGVQVEHRHLAAYVAAVECRLGLPSGAIYATVSTIAADLGNTPLFLSLAAGGCLHLLAGARVGDPGAMVSYLGTRRIDCLKIVPSHLAALWEHPDRERLLPARRLVFGGEALPRDLVAAVAPALEAGARIVNHYGPTETTVGATAGEVTSDGAAAVPIGRPLAGTRVHVVDARGRTTPLGVAGELQIGGAGVSRGYAGRPTRTAESFVPDPFSGLPGVRLYRTGDLARQLPDGTVVFSGRIDRQLEIRGFRVEPGEIESELRAHATVAEVAVVAWSAGASAELAAYVVPQAGRECHPAELRSFLARRLPDHQVPAVFVSLPELPRTANGKLDRAALPDPSVPGPAAASAPRDRSPTEAIVAGIWGELLGRREIRSDERFFDLGGHSLLATRMISRVRVAFGVEVPLRRVFEAPSLAGFARAVEATRGRTGPALPPIERREAEAPLSFSQERLWFLQRLDRESAAYNLPYFARLEGLVDTGRLAAALRRVVARHEELRARYPEVDGRPVREIAPSGGPRLARVDLARLAPSRAEAEVRRLAEDQARRPFDPTRDRLLRAVIVGLGREDHRLLLTLHHLVSDAWSRRNLVRELQTWTAVPGTDDGVEPSMPREPPAPSVRYRDFARWQRSLETDGALDDDLAWWRERLADLPPPLDLPTDRPRPAVRSGRGGEAHRSWPDELVAGVEAFARRHAATPFVVLLSAFAALLVRLTGRTDPVVGSPVAGRERPEVEDLIGFFVNTVVLPGDLSGDPGFAEIVRRQREVVLDALGHAAVPFERLVEELRPDRDTSSTPLFQVLFSFERVTPEASSGHRLGRARLLPWRFHNGTAKFDLTLTVIASDEGLDLALEHSADLFDPTTALRMAGQLRELTAAGLAHPERPLSLLPLLSVAQAHQVVREWGEAQETVGEAEPVPVWIAAQAARTPDAVALVHGDRRLSYRVLERRAARLAGRLRGAGVASGDRIIVCAHRGLDLVVALLGVWKAGGAYVPVDPAYPAARRRAILEGSEAAVAVVDRDSAGALEGASVRRLVVDAAEDGPARTSPAPRLGPPAEALAYAIYTSGSTGRPKGVAISHGSLAALVAWAHRTWPAEQSSGVVAATSICFDLSAFELFVPLTRGGSVILARDALALASLPEASRVTLINTVPSAMAELLRLAAEAPAVAAINLAGEPLRRDLVEALYRRWPRAAVRNLYGPSEDTTYSTVGLMRPGATGPPDIGRPVAGGRSVVLGPRLEPSPPGVPGELLVGGRGVSRGYLGWPAGTAASFVPDLHGPAGERLYRTGDLCRTRADGRLDFLGRRDRQVKVRGFRIELGEIEAALAGHPAVVEAAVAARSDGEDRELVGYVVADGAVSREALRSHVGSLLPEALVPTRWVFLDALPRLPNGKLDRASLPEPVPEVSGIDETARRAARTPTEELLAGIWEGVLGVRGLGVDDDFFVAGGHSLLATRVVARVRDALGVEVGERVLFTHPTVARLATEVERARRAGGPRREPPTAPPPIQPRDRSRPVPLAPEQEGLWFLHRLDPLASAYNLSAALELEGPLDVEALRRAFAGVVERQEALRTRIVTVDGEAAQEVLSAADGPRPLAVDLSALSMKAARTELERLARAEAVRPFDLSAGPLLRVTLARLGERRHGLLLSLHHLVGDAESLRMLVREVAEGYRAAVEGRSAALPPLPVSYADYAAWRRRRLAEDAEPADLSYWRERFSEPAPLLDLPTDRPRAPGSMPRGARHRLRLVAEDVETLARDRRATSFMVLLAAFQSLLAHWTGQGDVTVAVAMGNRPAPELEGVIGCFVQTLPLRTQLAEEPTFGRLVEHAREETLAAFDHRDVPPGRLLDVVRPDREASGVSPLQVAFAFQQEAATPELPGLRTRPIEVGGGEVKFDLSLFVRPADGGLDVVFEYRPDLWDRTTIARLSRRLEVLLGAVAARPDEPLAALDRLPSAERHQALHEWSSAPAARTPSPVHARFRERAAESPDAVAVVAREEHVSYGELVRRSSAASARLRAEGVGPGSVVAVRLPRSAAEIATTLGALGAGAAYLPLDPAGPSSRHAAMLEEAAVDALVSEGGVAGPDGSGPVDAPADIAVDGDSLAYVIYTSGSTGRPKGVALTHRGLADLVSWHLEVFGVTPADRVGRIASLEFDASVWELWPALAAGSALVLPDDEERLSPVALAGWLERHRVTTTFAPTPLAELLLRAREPAVGSLHTLLTGGDRLLVRPDRSLRLRVVNNYGPTEDTVVATSGPVAPTDDLRPPSLGRPIAGGRCLVLDRRLAPVPVGATGELCLGGTGLARGYLARPARTAEAFVPDPFGGPGDRLYRSGDLVRHRADGRLDFLGRADRQVQVRGVRVELAEVEAALLGHPGVREAVADVRGRGADCRLLAYAVTDGVSGEDGAPPSEGALKAHLRAGLPGGMVPARVVTLAALPRTPAGKIDRSALPEPAEDGAGRGGAVTPRTPSERTLVEIWEEVLGISGLGIETDFFDAGGHSLQAGRAIARIKEELGVDLPLRALFENTSPERMALAVTRAQMEDHDEAELATLLDELESVPPAAGEEAAADREPEGTKGSRR